MQLLWVNTILASCTNMRKHVPHLHDATEGGGEEGHGVPRHPVPAPRRHAASEDTLISLWRLESEQTYFPSWTSVQRMTTTDMTPHTRPRMWGNWYLDIMWVICGKEVLISGTKKGKIER